METLAHEQVHFDIAELIARRLRQRITQGHQTGEDLYGAQARQAIARIQQQEDALNDAFDAQAEWAGGHKHEAAVRQRWQQRIAHELKALAAYQAAPGSCPF